MEKRLLQIAIALAGLVAVSEGMVGGLHGTLMLGDWGDVTLDSQFRYLSGVVLAVGVAYWGLIPNIERQAERLSLVTLVIVTGGFFRALGLLADGSPGLVMRIALVGELVGAPLLYLWQRRIARTSTKLGAPMDAAAAER
jgi:Domain of unknown function (DUF4345)